MKYKGVNKIYFGIGLEDSSERMYYRNFYFYFFKLKQKPPEGEMLKRGRDYTGFYFSKDFKGLYFKINL